MAGQLVCFSPALSVTLVQVRSRKSVLTRIGVLPNKYKKGKGVFKEMIILIDNGISGTKEGHKNK